MDAFDRMMAAADPAMVIVTAHDGKRPAGCLVGFHSQSGISPPSLSVWLSKANHTFRVAVHTEHLGVHVLAAGDVDLARHFGGKSGDDVDKFATVDWRPGPFGVPLLDAVPRRLVGRKKALLDSGDDHVCVVLEPVETAASADDFDPLRLSAVDDVSPGHPAEDRPVPARSEARD